MVDRIEPTPLEDQLRRYGDALERRHRHLGSPPTPVEVEDRPRPIATTGRTPRRWRAVAAAAVVVAVVGGGAWTLWGDSPDRVATDDNDPVSDVGPPPDTTPTPFEIGQRPKLLPEGDQWVVVGATAHPVGDPPPGVGVWAWDTDEGIVILISSPARAGAADLGAAPSLESAQAESDPYRTTLVWSDGSRRLSLQGIGLDEEHLGSVAATLRSVDNGWVLDEARVLVAEPTAPPVEGDQIQVEIAPADRLLDERARVTSVVRPDSIGSLYAELHEASSLGPVQPTTIAGHPGYVIGEPDAQYALVAVDGWIVTWSTLEPSPDLSALLASLTPATAAQWDATIADGEQVRLDALAEAAAAIDLEAAYTADLPRYVLPEPWELAIATDMGLWTDEQWRQRLALFGASPQPPAAQLVWVQGFQAGTDNAALPMPEVVIEIHEVADPDVAPWIGGPGGTSEPYTLAGIEGHLSNEGAYGTWEISVVDDGHLVLISSYTLDRAGLVAFADSLTVRERGLGRGFSTSGDYPIVFDHPASPQRAGPTVTSWFTAWVAADGMARVTVEEARVDEFGLSLFHSWLPGSRYEVIRDTGETMVIGIVPSAQELANHGIGLSDGVLLSAISYDPARRLVIAVSVTDGHDPLSILDSLVEVDLDTWRALVEPVNADPQRPR